jgi:epoxyqueuosine reductase
MKASIRQRATELGFDDCRFTSADVPPGAPYFERWLTDQRHGEMAWLKRSAEKRVDPQKVLPGARTIIILAASYARPEATPEGAARADSGVIARYARFADYHEVLAGRLRTFTDFLNGAGGEGTRSLWYVDTGPLLERDLAQRSGLGFVGKHTNLISRRFGNWFFLAEIITTLDLEPEEPETNHCGKCARCLAACPTQAITAPFELDARKCISYLTIELKGSIPLALRSAIGNRIYGCDDCLAVCPWNRFAQQGRLMAAHARPDLDQPGLIDLLGLDTAGFKATFAGTPIQRAKRRGLLRNVCVALGNIGDARALPALERAAADPEPLIAEHACWAREEILRREEQPKA